MPFCMAAYNPDRQPFSVRKNKYHTTYAVKITIYRKTVETSI